MTNEKETARVEAFSDGVFAIAITLLILEIKVPEIGMHMTNSQLFTSLINLWPSYFSLWIFWIVLDYNKTGRRSPRKITSDNL